MEKGKVLSGERDICNTACRRGMSYESVDWQWVLFRNVMLKFRFRAYRTNGKNCRITALVPVARCSIAECLTHRQATTVVDDRAKTAAPTINMCIANIHRVPASAKDNIEQMADESMTRPPVTQDARSTEPLTRRPRLVTQGTPPTAEHRAAGGTRLSRLRFPCVVNATTPAQRTSRSHLSAAVLCCVVLCCVVLCCVVLCCVVLCCVVLCCVVLCCVVLCCVVLCCVVLCCVVLCCVVLCCVVLCCVCVVLLCCAVVLRNILSYPILSYPILSYPILSYPILSYPILSYPILSYPILSYNTLFITLHRQAKVAENLVQRTEA